MEAIKNKLGRKPLGKEKRVRLTAHFFPAPKKVKSALKKIEALKEELKNLT